MITGFNTEHKIKTSPKLYSVNGMFIGVPREFDEYGMPLKNGIHEHQSLKSKIKNLKSEIDSIKKIIE